MCLGSFFFLQSNLKLTPAKYQLKENVSILCFNPELMYPLEKPGGVHVDGAAPLGHEDRAVLASTLVDDLAVDKHWDQSALWESPHICLNGKRAHTRKTGFIQIGFFLLHLKHPP